MYIDYAYPRHRRFSPRHYAVIATLPRHALLTALRRAVAAVQHAMMLDVLPPLAAALSAVATMMPIFLLPCY